ncbi:MAG: hypothetical protein EOO77_12570 [Oxalobacteraceae bacterium]|nr:MAG: hypothetical protein EOO77_12570 [Oxalobacteraceae bacterium]
MKLDQHGFLEGASMRDIFLGWSIIGIPLATLLILGITLLKPDPISRQAVLGCYAARRAPLLWVRPDMIYVDHAKQGTFTYEAEPYKSGYHLSVAPALGLHPTANGKYRFTAEHGIGYFWELLPKGSAANMREPGDYSGSFMIIARDGTPITYKRVPLARCE